MYAIYDRDPQTGRISGGSRQVKHRTEAVIAFLEQATGWDPEKLVLYSVVDESTGKGTDAENWLEANAAAMVVAVYTAGGRAARGARQAKLREWWPALALALDVLEANSPADGS